MNGGTEVKSDGEGDRQGPRWRQYALLVFGAALSFGANTAVGFFGQWTCIGPFGCVLIAALGVWALGSTRLRAFGGGLLMGSLMYLTWGVLQASGLVAVLRV